MKPLSILFLVFVLVISGCGCCQPDIALHHLFAGKDSTAPTLISWEMTDPKTVRITFDEPVRLTTTPFSIAKNRIIAQAVSKTVLTLALENAMELASSDTLEGRIEDLSGNSRHFSLTLWAKNPNPAMLLINEFTTKGSAANPDRVELVVTARGNLAGLTLYAGTAHSYSDRIVFGDQWVEKGRYLVVSFKESDNNTSEYCSEELQGLGTNNGCLSLALSPEWESPVIDAVVWGNMSTTTFEGFGSAALLAQVNYLHEKGQWYSTQSKDSIDSTSSTATRSFCRYRFVDTNNAEDWYICDTREASFGEINSEKRYE